MGEFLIETGELKKGDEILVIGPTTGVIESEIQEIRVDDLSVDKAVKGDLCSILINQLVRRSDKLYRVIHKKL